MAWQSEETGGSVPAVLLLHDTEPVFFWQVNARSTKALIVLDTYSLLHIHSWGMEAAECKEEEAGDNLSRAGYIGSD